MATTTSDSWLQWPMSILPERLAGAAGRGKRSFFFVGVLAGITLSLGSLATALILADLRAYDRQKKKRRRRLPKGRAGADEEDAARGQGHNHRAQLIDIRAGSVVRGVDGLIGNTPLMRINSLSELTGCEILGKAEWLNPGGSPKDRVAKQILDEAEDEGLLHPHTDSCIFEGTVGSTGISLATLARSRGYRCSIVIPDDVAKEKTDLLRKLGAQIEAVRPRGIVDPRHFVNEAKRRAEAFGQTELIGPHAYDEGADAGVIPGWDGERRQDLVLTTDVNVERELKNDTADELELRPRGFFADQFENVSNFYAHYHGTGPEIWRQTGGMIDAFVAGAGTGGTLAGTATFLKEAIARANQSDSEDENDSDTEEQSWFQFRFGGPSSPTSRIRPDPLRSDSNRQQGDEDVPWHTSTRSLFASLGQTEQEDRTIDIVLADPQGSGLFNKVKYGVIYNQTEAEGKRRRHQVDTVVEGIGLNRLTRNFELGLDYYDDAVSVTDEEAVRMSRHLVLHDGLFLGSSSAVNCVAAVKTALRLKRQRKQQEASFLDQLKSFRRDEVASFRRDSDSDDGTDELAQSSIVVVTILCDSGARHLSKFWNDDALAKLNIPISDDITPILADAGGDSNVAREK